MQLIDICGAIKTLSNFYMAEDWTIKILDKRNQFKAHHLEFYEKPDWNWLLNSYLFNSEFMTEPFQMEDTHFKNTARLKLRQLKINLQLQNDLG